MPGLYTLPTGGRVEAWPGIISVSSRAFTGSLSHMSPPYTKPDTYNSILRNQARHPNQLILGSETISVQLAKLYCAMSAYSISAGLTVGARERPTPNYPAQSHSPSIICCNAAWLDSIFEVTPRTLRLAMRVLATAVLVCLVTSFLLHSGLSYY